MTIIKVSEASGPALDWMVAKCDDVRLSALQEHGKFEIHFAEHNGGHIYTPSTDWAQGGPIIERERIATNLKREFGKTETGAEFDNPDGWLASKPKAYWQTVLSYHGPTPLIAAMRCFVVSKLGETVDVPEELLK